MKTGTHARARRLVENIYGENLFPTLSMVMFEIIYNLYANAKSCGEVGRLKYTCQGENLSLDLLIC